MMILIMHQSHESFHPVAVYVSPKHFLGEVLSSQIEEPLQKKKRVHLYRSTVSTTRQTLSDDSCYRFYAEILRN